MKSSGANYNAGLYKCFKDETELPSKSALVDLIQQDDRQHYNSSNNLSAFKRLLINEANVCYFREGGDKGSTSTAVVVAAPEHHRGRPDPILPLPVSTFVRPPRSWYEGEPDHPSVLLAASTWFYNYRRRQPHSVAATGRFLMSVAIDTGVARLVSRLVCHGLRLVLRALSCSIRALSCSIHAAVVAGLVSLQCTELFLIAMCFPISLAWFVKVGTQALLIESYIRLVDFLALRRHHANYVSKCIQRFCRPGPLICSAVSAYGWLQHGTDGSSTAQLTRQSMSAAVMLVSLFTDSIHFAARGRISSLSVGCASPRDQHLYKNRCRVLGDGVAEPASCWLRQC